MTKKTCWCWLVCILAAVVHGLTGDVVSQSIYIAASIIIVSFERPKGVNNE